MNGYGMGNSAAVPGMGNVLAPPGYAGLGSATAEGVDFDYTYVYDVNLTADQILNNQQVPLQTDADFELRAVVLAKSGDPDDPDAFGRFQYRLTDSQGFQFSDNFIDASVLQAGGVSVPWPMFPSPLFPKGGRIGIDIQDLSGEVNVVQLLFRGVKRYMLPGS